MHNLIVKSVDFFGDSLIAVKDDVTGKIYTGISFICNGIGFTKGQKDRQVLNIQNDIVLKRGCLKFEAGVIDPNNETLAIDIEFLPLWLAKISITPKMQEEQPEVTEKLVNYQLKAKDVLAEAFIKKPEKPTCIEDVLISSLQEMKALKGEVQVIKQGQLETQEQLQGIRDVVAINSNDWKNDCKNLITKIAYKLGGIGHIQDVYKEVYSLLDRRLGTKLQVRLTNKRRRMADEGVCKSRRDKLSYINVIEDDKKLIEGYVAIVKELAIKYGTDLGKEEREV